MGPRVGMGRPDGSGRTEVKESTGTVGSETVDWQHCTLARHWARGIVSAEGAALDTAVGGRVARGLASTCTLACNAGRTRASFKRENMMLRRVQA